MLRRVFALLLLGLLAAAFAHADGAQPSASDCLEAPAQLCAAPDSVDVGAAGSMCSFVCPASACIASFAVHHDFDTALMPPSAFHAAPVLSYLRAPDTAPPRFFSL